MSENEKKVEVKISIQIDGSTSTHASTVLKIGTDSTQDQISMTPGKPQDTGYLPINMSNNQKALHTIGNVQAYLEKTIEENEGYMKQIKELSEKLALSEAKVKALETSKGQSTDKTDKDDAFKKEVIVFIAKARQAIKRLAEGGEGDGEEDVHPKQFLDEQSKEEFFNWITIINYNKTVKDLMANIIIKKTEQVENLREAFNQALKFVLQMTQETSTEEEKMKNARESMELFTNTKDVFQTLATDYNKLSRKRKIHDTLADRLVTKVKKMRREGLPTSQ